MSAYNNADSQAKSFSSKHSSNSEQPDVRHYYASVDYGSELPTVIVTDMPRGTGIRGATIIHTVEPFMIERIADELTTELAGASQLLVRRGIVVSVRKYYHAAFWLTRRISAFDLSPVFVIDAADLSPGSLAALRGSPKPVVHYILRKAVMRILENVNFDYTHLSILAKLRIEVRSK